MADLSHEPALLFSGSRRAAPGRTRPRCGRPDHALPTKATTPSTTWPTSGRHLHATSPHSAAPGEPGIAAKPKTAAAPPAAAPHLLECARETPAQERERSRATSPGPPVPRFNARRPNDAQPPCQLGDHCRALPGSGDAEGESVGAQNARRTCPRPPCRVSR